MFLLLYYSIVRSLGAPIIRLSRRGFIAPRAPNLDRSAIKEARSEYFIGGRKEARKGGSPVTLQDPFQCHHSKIEL